MRKWLRFSFIAVVCGQLINHNAEAAPVTHFFQGAVTSVPAALSDEFKVGDVITGEYRFESTTESTGTGMYIFSVDRFTTTIGAYTFNSSILGDIQVVDGGAEDQYTVTSLAQGPSLGSLNASLQSIQFTGGEMNVFNSHSLPLTGVDPAKFTSPLFTLDFQPDLDRLVGRIDILGVVPEPSSVVLVGLSCLGGLACRGSRRRSAAAGVSPAELPLITNKRST